MHLALKYPELFTRVISMSGAFYSASQEIYAAAEDLSWLSIWMIVGLQETAFEADTGTYDFVQLNRDTRDLLEKRGARLLSGERRESPMGLLAKGTA